MKKVLLPINIAFVFLIFSASSYSEIITLTSDLKINEILASNSIINKDEYGEYDDWVELYNSGDDTINLNGLYLSDTKQNLAKYQITIDTLLAPKSYVIIWTDGEPEQGPLHTNFKLSKKGENLFICDANFLVLDSIFYKQQATNISYGRLQSNFMVWNYFITPTPGEPNTEEGFLDILAAPTVNRNSGFYSSPTCITISHPDKDVKIVFTLNGDIPNNNSDIYESCINIDKTTVLRFRAIKEGYIPSKEQTRSYFFNTEHELDIVSIVAPGNGLEGSSGILDKKDKELEKPVHFEYFGKDKNLKFKLDGGLSLHSPKSNPQYSVRFYARSAYGTECINYPIFANKEITEYRRLVLRNAGNDGTAQDRSSLIHFRDGFHHILFQKMGYPQASSSFKPLNLYVNGEYYGIYNLRERIDKYFIASNYGYEGDMDLIEINWFGENKRNIYEGNFEQYDSFTQTLLKSNDKIANYETLKSNINIEEYIDYCILEIYVGNFDWILNNIKMFRPHTPEGKFEFLLWDTDHGSGLPYKDYGKVTWNTFEWAISIGMERTESAINTVILRRLLEHEPARNQFINRFADMMNTIFMPNSTSLVIDSLGNLIANDMKLHAARWNTDYKEWEDALEYVKNFHDKRPSIVFNHIKDYYNIKRLYEITLKVNDPKAGRIKINTIIPEFEDSSWTGTYFSDIPVTLQAIPNKGYHFVGWKTLSPSKQSILNVSFESDKTVEAIFAIGATNIDEISLHQNNNSNNYSVYPNPASSYIAVKNNSEVECFNCKTEILVFNLMGGKCIHETHYGKSDITLETKNLKSGLYIIRIFENNNIVFSGNISIIK
ncbi:MAG: CotH kinase family protein [Bacteroidales bacterium]